MANRAPAALAIGAKERTSPADTWSSRTTTRCSLLKRLRERIDVEVLTAATAERALSLVEHGEDRIGVVIADVHLPGMSGVALAKELRRRDPTIAVLLVSGDFDAPDGGFLKLDKPFTLDALEQRSRPSCRRRRTALPLGYGPSL